MVVYFWGVRGSLATPLRTTEYQSKLKKILARLPEKGLCGDNEINTFIKSLPSKLKNIVSGNTTSLSIQSKNNNTYIIDGGSGIRVLGERLMKAGAAAGNSEYNIFITHTHWDHICGLPFFKPLYIPGNIINFYSPFDDLHDRLRYQQEDRFFPMPFDRLASTRNFFKLNVNDPVFFENGDLKVTAWPLKHPGTSYAYKFESGNRSFIMATDAEFTGESLEGVNEARDNFFNNCDVLVIDTQYTLDESFQKFDWGHTSVTMAVNCASSWNVKNLILTHHEPSYHDDKIYKNLNLANQHKSIIKHEELNIFLARENMKITLPEK